MLIIHIMFVLKLELSFLKVIFRMYNKDKFETENTEI